MQMFLLAKQVKVIFLISVTDHFDFRHSEIVIWVGYFIVTIPSKQLGLSISALHVASLFVSSKLGQGTYESPRYAYGKW